MEVRRYLRFLRRWWWLLLIATFLAGGSSYLAARSQPRIYSSRARVLVGTSIQSLNPDWMAISTAEQLALTYAELATTRPVLQGVIDACGFQTTPDVLRNMISVRVAQGTQILDIAVVDADPNRAAEIANAVAEELIRRSPGGTESTEASIRRDVEEQLRDLKARIDFAKQEIQNLDAAILEEDSARAIAELKNRQDLLRQQVTQWQATYAQLYAAYTGNQANTLTLVERAEPNYTPIGPQTTTNVLLAGAIGAMLAIGAALLLEYLDDTVKSGDEVVNLTGFSFLGVIPRIPAKREPAEQLLTLHQPRSNFAESFRVLRTNLQFSGLDRPLRTILVTSPQPIEGKSTVVANLAVVLAQAGQRVIVIDTDLRRPILHHFFDKENTWGLTGMLFGEEDRTGDGLLPTEVENLRFVPSGPLPPNPSEVLASGRMATFLAGLREQADILLFDSPPLLTVADASILAAHVDGILLVVDAGKTRREALKKAAEALRRVGAPVLGVVLNRVPVRSEDYYYYSYYYSDEGERRRVRRRRSRRREEKATRV